MRLAFTSDVKTAAFFPKFLEYIITLSTGPVTEVFHCHFNWLTSCLYDTFTKSSKIKNLSRFSDSLVTINTTKRDVNILCTPWMCSFLGVGSLFADQLLLLFPMWRNYLFQPHLSCDLLWQPYIFNVSKVLDLFWANGLLSVACITRNPRTSHSSFHKSLRLGSITL